MTDLTVIILTYNEEIHLVRCIESVKSIASKILVVDSFSTDHTLEIAESYDADLVQRVFLNQADQFQWALDTYHIDTSWVMRIDADEYLEPELQTELSNLLSSLPDDIDGIYLKRKVLFNGKWIRYGGFYPHILLRVWRTGKARIEQRWMDEHIVLSSSQSKIFIADEHLIDYNLKGITSWIEKHNKYASREAVDILNLKYHFIPHDKALTQTNDPQAQRKRKVKELIYVRLPSGLRAFAYFLYRYIFLFGFLDGKDGFIWHFMQGLWYRLLVDVKIMELEKRGDYNTEKMKALLRDQHGLEL